MDECDNNFRVIISGNTLQQSLSLGLPLSSVTSEYPLMRFSDDSPYCKFCLDKIREPISGVHRTEAPPPPRAGNWREEYHLVYSNRSFLLRITF